MTIFFDRDEKGDFHEDSNILSILYAKDAYLLEDELNESQWNQIETQANILRGQYTSGILSDFNIVQVDNDNAYLESTDGKPLTILVDGYSIKIGGNKHDNLLSLDSRVLFDPTPEPADNHNVYHYLDFWFEVVNYASELRKFGGEDSAPITNDIFDDRIQKETSRRVQMKWKVGSTSDINFLDFIKVENGLWKKTDAPTYDVTSISKSLVNPGITYRIIFSKGTDSFSGFPEKYDPSTVVLKDNSIKKDLEKKFASLINWDDFKDNLTELEDAFNTEIQALKDQIKNVNDLIDDVNLKVDNNTNLIDALDKALKKMSIQLELHFRVPNNNGSFVDIFDGSTSDNRITMDDTTAYLVADVEVGETVLPLSTVDGFSVNDQVTIFNDTNNEDVIILAIDPVAKTITVAPIKNAYPKGTAVARSNSFINLADKYMTNGYWTTYDVEVIDIV